MIKKGVRNVAIICLLFDLALRRAELVSLDLEDVNLQAKALSIVGKGMTQKTSLILPDPTAKTLETWLQVRGDAAGPLFLSLEGLVFDPII